MAGRSWSGCAVPAMAFHRAAVRPKHFSRQHDCDDGSRARDEPCGSRYRPPRADQINVRVSRACRQASVQSAPLVSRRQPEPFLTCGLMTAEPHIRSPLIAAGTKIPHTRGHRARKSETNLYHGISQPGRYAVRSPRSSKGQLPSRMARILL
jgi:hypothetical protein